MQQWVAALFLVLAAAESFPSQPRESHPDSTITDARTGPPGDAPLQSQPVAMPSSSDSNAAAEAEVLHRFNELRREFLDYRAKTVDWWLTATAIFLTLLGIVAVFAGYLSFKRFREIETEARESAESAKEHAKKAGDIVDEIKAQHDEAVSLVQGITAESVSDNPDEVRRATESVQEDPTASPIDQAVAVAVQLQQGGKIKESIEKWHAIAIISEEIDKDRAARAWFSVGYLRQEPGEDALKAAIGAYNKSICLKPDLAEAYNNRGNAKGCLGRYEEAIADHDEAIRLKPDLAEAYNNRGNAKGGLGRHEEAIADYDEAIRLNPDYAMAYYNRGRAKNNLGRHEKAIADYDEAIRLNPDYAMAYYNRGRAKNNLGRHEEAIADYDKAIQLKADYAEAYYNRGLTNAFLNRVGKARRDFEAAIALAREAGNEDLVSAAEHALKELPDEQTP